MCFRGIFSIIGMTICVGALPYYAKNADHLAMCVGLTGIIGLCSAIVYGSFYQIASLINSNGWLQAAFAMGYQGSGILVLIVSLAVDFDADASDRQVSIYFISIAGLEFFSLLCFLILMCKRRLVRSQLVRRDSAVALSSALARTPDNVRDIVDEDKNKSKPSPPPTPSPDMEQPLLKSSNDVVDTGDEMSYKDIVR